jgi:hypothetical protein
MSSEGAVAYDAVRPPRHTSRLRSVGLLQNHMLMVSIQEKLDQLANRKTGERNPFIVGTTAYQKFVDVMAACTNVNLARRKQ